MAINDANVAVIGADGMLGHMVTRVLGNTMPPIQYAGHREFDAEQPDYDYIKAPVIVNCIGLIKPYCDDVQRAIRVNSLFPYTLPAGTIQIATDCVYSGRKGKYVETDLHDAEDVYGKTKSLGEAPQLKNLRCSIIGPELKNHLSLLDWFLAQEGEVNGFINHWWNGITTYHFGKIVDGIIREGIELPAIQHIVPALPVTKFALLKTIAKVYGKDIQVNAVHAPQRVDRTLSTNDKELNLRLWKAAGYNRPPTIAQMIKELRDFDEN